MLSPSLSSSAAFTTTTKYNTSTILNINDELVNNNSNGDSKANGNVDVSTPVEEFEPVKECTYSDTYAFLAETFDLVSATRSRLLKHTILVNFFRQLLVTSQNSIMSAIWLSTNKLVNCFETWTLGVGGSTVSACLQEVTGAKPTTMSALYRELGDMGDVAYKLKSKQRLLHQPKALSINGVYNTLKEIGNMSGTGSEKNKKNSISKMLRSCRRTEIKWLVRTLIANIRTGATMDTILSCMAVATMHHYEYESKTQVPDKIAEKKAQDRLKLTFSLCPAVDQIVNALIRGGLELMEEECQQLRINIPIQPMLAKPLNDIELAVRRFGAVGGNSVNNNKQKMFNKEDKEDKSNENIRSSPEYLSKSFTAEYKYDGQRAQIHYHISSDKEATVKIFSRNLEDMTLKYPDVVEVLKKCAHDSLESCILDAEIVPVEIDDNNQIQQILPFQELSKRGRKDVSISNTTVSVCVYIFDVLYLNNESLLEQPLISRREILIKHLSIEKHTCMKYTQRIDIHVQAEEGMTTLEEAMEILQEHLQRSVEAGCEGLMLKQLEGDDSTYIPCRASERHDSWGKLKKDYLDSLADSMDLIPIGAWYGNGRKAGWFSPYLLACVDTNSGKLQSLCRVMSGLTDEFYKQQTEYWKQHMLSRDSLEAKEIWDGLDTEERPSVLFDPETRDKIVWEIRGADLSLSPVHRAGTGAGIANNMGVGLRFPRFIRVRDDKTRETATTSKMIVEAFNNQSQRKAKVNDMKQHDEEHEKDEKDNEDEEEDCDFI